MKQIVKKVENKPSNKKIIALSLAVFYLLFPEFLMEKTYATEKTPAVTIEQVLEEVPENIIEDVCYNLDIEDKKELTIEDIINTESLYITIENSKEDIEYLKYFPKTIDVTIINESENSEALEKLECAPRLEYLTILSNEQEITKENLSFVKKCSHLKEISIIGGLLAPGSEEILREVPKINLYFSQNLNIDFSKLTGGNLKEIVFIGDNPYDEAINFTSKDNKCLENDGIKITFENKKQKQTVEKINKELDELIESMDIKETDNDKEKLKKILKCVYETLSYNEQVMKNENNGIIDEELINKFYENGFLYGAIEMDDSLCGNYASLVQAFCKRVLGSEACYTLISEDHAWNLIKIDKKTYYTDATLTDNSTIIDPETEKELTAEEALEKGLESKLAWYMVEIGTKGASVFDFDPSHIPTSIPNYMMNNQDDEDYYMLEIGNEKIIIPMTLVVLFLTIKIIEKAMKEENKKEKIKRRTND